jgi:hypothetical protein
MVGSHPITNERSSFNYSCLEVKNKRENQRKTKKEEVFKNLHKPFKNILKARQALFDVASVGP